MSVGDTYTDADGTWRVTGVNTAGEVTSAVLVEPSEAFLNGLPDPVEPEPVVNRGDLLLAIFATLGKPKARALNRDYGDAALSIQHGNWEQLGEAMAEMIQNGDLNAEEVTALNALFKQFGVVLG